MTDSPEDPAVDHGSRVVAKPPWRCRLRWHRWKFAHGDFHQYFECSRCQARTVRTGAAGDLPVDDRWLRHKEPRQHGPGPPIPLYGWDGLIFWADGRPQL